MSGNKNKMKLSNVIMDFIIAGICIVLAIVIVNVNMKKNSDNGKKTTSSEKATEGPAKEKEPSSAKTAEDDVVRYSIVTSSGDNNDTSFYVEFKTADKTFKEGIIAGNQTSALGDGTFEDKEDSYEVTYSSSNKKDVYYKDGEYIVPQSALYKGDVPEGETFDGKYVFEIKDQCRNTVTFKKDGTYEQKLVSFKAKDGKDSVQKTEGTYKRDGLFISCNQSDGRELMPFYVYKNQLANGYYKLEK